MSPYIVLSVLVYLSDEYFWKDLGQIRNAMSSGIVLWSVFYAHKKKFFKFTALILLASLFHAAASVGIVLYFLPYLAKRKVMLCGLLFSIFIAGTGGLGESLVNLALLFDLDSGSRIVKYASRENISGISFLGGTFLVHSSLSLLMIYFYPRLVRKWEYNKILIPSYVFGSILFFLFLDYGIIAGRVREMLCVPTQVIILPSFLLLFNERERLIPWGLIVCYCYIWFYSITRLEKSYESILQFLI